MALAPLHVPLAERMLPAPRTSLDPNESNDGDPRRAPADAGGHVDGTPYAGPDLPDDPEVAWRHRDWQPTRRRVYRALHAAGLSDRTLARFAWCGCAAWVEKHPTEEHRYRVRCQKCKNRWCLPCAREKARRLWRQITAYCEGRAVRLITLTIRHQAQPLRVQVDWLLQSFAKLRKRRLWKDNITGGIAVLEVHHNGGRTGWHPHLHILAEGAFINQRDLAVAWHTCTTTSYVVDIRAPSSGPRAVSYVLKYLSRPLHKKISHNPTLLAEAVEALHNRKLLITFGTWRDLRLTDPDPEPVDWTPVAPLAEILRKAANGDTEARRILAQISGPQLSDVDLPSQMRLARATGPAP